MFFILAVARYHGDTIRAFLELVASTGHDDPSEVGPRDVLRRIDATTIKRFGEIYEYLPEGLLLEQQGVPPSWAANWNRASADHF